MQDQIRRISSHYLLTPQGLLRKGILSFNTQGTLLDISTPSTLDNNENVEFFSGLLIPGMVNAHCHLELSYLKGEIARGCGFAGFANTMMAVREKTNPKQREDAARYWDAKMYSEGVTAVGDICNGMTSFPIKEKSKIHYHSFIELFGLRNTDCTPIKNVVSSAENMGLDFSPTPHSTYSLQDAPFKEVCAMSVESGRPISVHFMESRGEVELFSAQGMLHARNMRDGLVIDFEHYGSPTNRIIESIPKGAEIMLIHNTFVTEEDVRRIVDHFGTKNITWVLCPRSNAFIEEAKPPVDMLKTMGVRIAVGTDSLASNDSLSMIEEMKTLQNIAGGRIPLEEMLSWATINGAQALSLDSWAGSFEVGKYPGAVLINGIDWEKMELLPNASSKRIV